MTTDHAAMRRTARAGAASLALLLSATASFAQAPAAAAPKIDAGDTAWMIAATALVLMMTIPGLALFYAGMVRKKNVLNVLAMSFASVAVISLLWAIAAYSLVFAGDGAVI